MTSEKRLDAMSIHIPCTRAEKRPVERLGRLEKRDRSANYLVVEAILECLDREEEKR